MPDTQLEPDRLAARKIAQLGDEFHQADGGGKRAVRGRRNAINPHRDAACLGYFRGDFGGGQHAAMAGLGPLAQLYLDHLDLRVGCGLGKAFLGKSAVVVAASEIPRRHLINQIPATFAVIPADAALTGVMGKAALFRPLVQRQNGIAR